MASILHSTVRPAGVLAVALCAASAAAAAAPGPTPIATVTASAAGWAIDARRADRTALAQELARVSRSELHGAPAALAQTRPLTLQWRGTSLAEAWQQVLGQEASYALQCAPRRCRVWVVGPVQPTAGSAAPANGLANSTARPVERALQPDPPGLFPAD